MTRFRHDFQFQTMARFLSTMLSLAVTLKIFLFLKAAVFPTFLLSIVRCRSKPSKREKKQPINAFFPFQTFPVTAKPIFMFSFLINQSFCHIVLKNLIALLCSKVPIGNGIGSGNLSLNNPMPNKSALKVAVKRII